MTRNTLAKLVGGTCSTAALYIGYDYKTCHPMRKIQLQGYNVDGALVRFHNTLIQHRLLPTTSMTLIELAKYNGEGNNTKIFFSSDGWIWDATASESFRDAYGLWRGKDATVALAKMSMDPRDVNRTDWENLTDTEQVSLKVGQTISAKSIISRDD